MKKNISINLQGLIFHIEEDGYDVLSRYLAEVKAHFAGIRGHQDIVADIEGRIAEIFAARLSPSQQVITLDDVEAMTVKMGRVSDFESETDEDDVATDQTDTFGTAGTSTAAGSTSYTGSPATPSAAPTTAAGPRRLYRDMVNRKIAGVAAGLAQYFMVNPLWVRLGFLAFIFLPRLVFHNGFNFGFRGNFDLSGFSFLAYIVLWIALPKNYDVVPVTPDTDTPYKKLFRDTDTGKIGGVASGLAAYLNTDVTLVRVLLLAGLFAGGFTFVLYLILWAVLPEAKTVAEKMRMRGDDLTLKNFSQNINNFASEVSAAGRPLGTFVEGVGRGLQPAVGFVGSAIRVAAGILLTLIGFALLLGLAILLGAGIGLIPNSENIVAGDVPAHVLLNGIPTWGLLAGFLAAGIPSLFLLLGGLNLLLRRSILSRTVSLSLLGLWILSIVGLTMTVAQQSRQYQRSAEVEQLERYAALTTPVIFLNTRHVDREWDQHVNVRLAAADSGRAVEVLRTLGARGASEEAARRTALSTIDYTVRPSGDSSLVFDDHFSFLPGASFRKQELALTIRLPRDRTFRLSRKFAYDLLGDDDFVNSHRPTDPEQHRYRLRGNKLECIGCSDEEMGKTSDDGQTKLNLNIDTNTNDNADNNSGDDNTDENADNNSSKSGVTLNYGGAPAFDTDLNSYGSNRRTFEETGFTRVEVVGGYRVVVRRGAGFKVEAGGDNKYLDDLRVERDGNALVIRPRNNSFFGGNWGRSERKVLIRVEMPAIEALQLAGAVQADLGGFDRQDRLKVEQAGASHLRLNGNYGTLKVEQAGACRTTATGRADNLDLDAAGACELAAANLQTKNITLDLAGVCKARLNVSESIKGNAVGASEIAFSGKPKTENIDATGPSSIKRL